MTGPAEPAEQAATEQAVQAERAAAEEREPPPILGTWPRLYTAVLVNLALLIALLYWLTRALA